MRKIFSITSVLLFWLFSFSAFSEEDSSQKTDIEFGEKTNFFISAKNPIPQYSYLDVIFTCWQGVIGVGAEYNLNNYIGSYICLSTAPFYDIFSKNLLFDIGGGFRLMPFGRKIGIGIHLNGSLKLICPEIEVWPEYYAGIGLHREEYFIDFGFGPVEVLGGGTCINPIVHSGIKF